MLCFVIVLRLGCSVFCIIGNFLINLIQKNVYQNITHKEITQQICHYILRKNHYLHMLKFPILYPYNIPIPHPSSTHQVILKRVLSYARKSNNIKCLSMFLWLCCIYIYLLCRFVCVCGVVHPHFIFYTHPTHTYSPIEIYVHVLYIKILK